MTSRCRLCRLLVRLGGTVSGSARVAFRELGWLYVVMKRWRCLMFGT